MNRTPWHRVLFSALMIFVASIATSCGSAEDPEKLGTARLPATVPSGFVDEVFVSGLSSPTAMAFAPDGRLFVCQQGGALRVVKNGSLLSTPFLTVSVNSAGERGLLGVTFDPNFATNQFVYVYYTTAAAPIHNRLSRFTANGDVAVAGSELQLLNLNNLSATNHNGGALHFRNDGKLYVAVGENAVGANAQSMSNLLGKILRLNSDGTIPSDNPFFNTATGNNRAIWALGLRNPFTFAIQPGTNRMFINDVGEVTWEEINDGIAGSNYGWPNTEGETTNPSFRSPLFVYNHTTGITGCAITGGTFYNPATVQFPGSWVGKYFYADFCSGFIRAYNPASDTSEGFATGVSAPVDLRVGSDGALYYLARGAGQVGRIRFTGSQAPAITTHPSSQTRSVGQSVTFSVVASGTAPLSYQWQRNGTNISGATSPNFTISSVTTGDNGAMFRAVVTNSFGSATSNAATLTVTTNTPPTANITAPAAGTMYAGGQVFNFSGTGTDTQDGTLPASAFTWRVDFHHDTHVHPHVQPFSGQTSGSFTADFTGHPETNVFYRIVLTVRDSGGLTTTVTRDVTPRIVTISLATNPPGLQVTLDDQPRTTPLSVQSVVGVQRVLGVVSPQTSGSQTFVFSSWSHGGAATQTITTPATNTTFTANYVATTSGLIGEYFDNIDLTLKRVTRVDQTVNFNFGTGTPDPLVGPDTFSARWTGSVIPQFTQNYTFYTTSDDGVRLWIDGALVINNWTNHSATENTSAPIALTAGRSHLIQMEFFENGGDAVATLSWSSASQAKQIIPSARLSTALPFAFPLNINYQLAGAPIPGGYVPDEGNVFGFRGSGRTFGWNILHTDLTRDRGINADQRLDTLCHFHAGGVWEAAVPNGSYDVFVSIGDAGFASTHTILVEGVSYWNALALNPNQFANLTRTVTVQDGRLTITQGSAVDKATRINYVHIQRL